MIHSQHLIVFAKAPRPRFAKTRLIPALGAQAAAALAERLFEHTMQTVMALRGRSHTSLELCVAGPEGDDFFVRWLESHHAVKKCQLTRQQGADLGARMQQALDRALSQHERVMVIGTDAPSLGVPVIETAFDVLNDHDAVFVPAFDGGYALVGLRAPTPELFHDVAWGSAQVMQTSRERLSASGKTWRELGAVHDIDEPGDLIHLPSDWLTDRKGPESPNHPTHRA